MNDLLRLLQRGLRPFGYDIRRRHSYNLLPCKGIAAMPELDNVRRIFDNDHAQEKFPTNLDTLKIIFRTCLTETRNQKAHERVAASPLIDTVEHCFRSLVTSVNAALAKPDAPQISILILDDHSDAVCLDRIRAIATHLKCQWSLETTRSTGQGASLHEQFTRARADDALYYFCEDDYLHDPRAIYEMVAFYRQIYVQTRRHLLIHPQEHGCLYNSSFYPSYLVLSPYRHWRSVADATHIFLTHSHVVRDYWDYFENTKWVGDRKNRRLGSERRTTNRLFEHIPGFVPLPALAGHMQAPELLPPFFDWRALWDANDPRRMAS